MQLQSSSIESGLNEESVFHRNGSEMEANSDAVEHSELKRRRRCLDCLAPSTTPYCPSAMAVAQILLARWAHRTDESVRLLAGLTASC